MAVINYTASYEVITYFHIYRTQLSGETRQWVTLCFAETKVSNFRLRPKVWPET